MSASAAQHPLEVGQRRVAAQQPVLAQQPQIARPRDRAPAGPAPRRIGQARPCRAASSRSSSPSSKPISSRSKPSAEGRRARPQQRLVPAGVQRQLVVGQHVGALLRLAQTRELDHRHAVQPQLPGRQQPAMAGDDAVLAVDQDRVGPAELRMVAAICATWASECVRALRAYGISSSSGRQAISRSSIVRTSQRVMN